MDTDSSGFMGLNSTAVSSYGFRQAGQRPFKFSLMWCQQKRQICASIRFAQEGGWSGTHLITTRTGLEVEIGDVHLLEAEGTFHVLLCVERIVSKRGKRAMTTESVQDGSSVSPASLLRQKRASPWQGSRANGLRRESRSEPGTL
jgi:hypothetical protein